MHSVLKRRSLFINRFKAQNSRPGGRFKFNSVFFLFSSYNNSKIKNFQIFHTHIPTTTTRITYTQADIKESMYIYRKIYKNFED